MKPKTSKIKLGKLVKNRTYRKMLGGQTLSSEIIRDGLKAISDRNRSRDSLAQRIPSKRLNTDPTSRLSWNDVYISITDAMFAAGLRYITDNRSKTMVRYVIANNGCHIYNLHTETLDKVKNKKFKNIKEIDDTSKKIDEIISRVYKKYSSGISVFSTNRFKDDIKSYNELVSKRNRNRNQRAGETNKRLEISLKELALKELDDVLKSAIIAFAICIQTFDQTANKIAGGKDIREDFSKKDSSNTIVPNKIIYHLMILEKSARTDDLISLQIINNKKSFLPEKDKIQIGVDELVREIDNFNNKTKKYVMKDSEIAGLKQAITSSFTGIGIPVSSESNAPTLAEAIIPRGVKPGQTFKVNIKGQIIDVKVPRGAVEGSTIQFPVPPNN